MKKQLLNNWPLKLVSLLAAVGIWLTIMFITDPSTTKSFTVPITLVNENIITERGKSVNVTGDQYVTVRVTKNRSIVNALKTADFKATADFSKMYEDSQVPVSVTCNSSKISKSDYTQDKFSLEIELESLATVTVPIVYELTGDPADGFAIGDVQLEPSTVTVTAPASYAGIIREAVVTIDVDGVSEDYTTQEVLRIYDGNGALLEPSESRDTVIDFEGKITCNVRVFLIKRVPVIVEATNTNRVADGYTFVGATVVPDTVTISGTRAVMAQVSSITIDDVSAAGLTDSRTIEVDLNRFLPDSVTIVDDNSKAHVTLMAERYVEKSFTIASGKIKVVNVPEGMEYRITTSAVNITILGLEADLASMSEDDIGLTLDLTGFRPGTASVTLKVELPSDVYQQKGNVAVNVRLTEIQTTAEAGDGSGED